MIYAKTVCSKPGSFVEVVPAGLLAKLQYNQNGVLQKIEIATDIDSWEEVESDIMAALRPTLPQKISVTQGTTWVEGVFYFPSVSFDSGSITYDANKDYLERIRKGDQSFSFFAASVDSKAISFNGALACRNWLSFNKFQIVPGTVVPVEFTEDTIKMLCETGNYKFKYPYIGGYYVYNVDTCEYLTSGLTQVTVKSVKTVLTESGYIQAYIETDSGEEMHLNYNVICNHKIQEGATILYYEDEFIEIVDVRKMGGILSDVPRMLTCSVCHKSFRVPVSGPVQCDDDHCLSRQYSDVKRILSVLDLPKMSYDEYMQNVKSRMILTATDVLELDKYKDLIPESITLAAVLRAAIPYDVCTDTVFLDKFVRSCNNSQETVIYYLNNPQRIITELDVASISAKRFITWCTDPYNVSTVMTLLSSLNVTPSVVDLDVAPIFRGMKFVITGNCKRGDYTKIVSILEQYAAKVLDSIDQDVPTAVITGGTNENISGHVIQAARQMGVPIIDEDSFFIQNEIDNDLMSQNLL